MGCLLPLFTDNGVRATLFLWRTEGYSADATFLFPFIIFLVSDACNEETSLLCPDCSSGQGCLRSGSQYWCCRGSCYGIHRTREILTKTFAVETSYLLELLLRVSSISQSILLLTKKSFLHLESALALPFISCRPSTLQCAFCGVSHIADTTKVGHKPTLGKEHRTPSWTLCWLITSVR